MAVQATQRKSHQPHWRSAVHFAHTAHIRSSNKEAITADGIAPRFLRPHRGEGWQRTNLEPKLCGLDCGNVSTGSAANDNDIVLQVSVRCEPAACAVRSRRRPCGRSRPELSHVGREKSAHVTSSGHQCGVRELCAPWP